MVSLLQALTKIEEKSCSSGSAVRKDRKRSHGLQEAKKLLATAVSCLTVTVLAIGLFEFVS